VAAHGRNRTAVITRASTASPAQPITGSSRTREVRALLRSSSCWIPTATSRSGRAAHRDGRVSPCGTAALSTGSTALRRPSCPFRASGAAVRLVPVPPGAQG
jgi:hypothetical protein